MFIISEIWELACVKPGEITFFTIWMGEEIEKEPKIIEGCRGSGESRF